MGAEQAIRQARPCRVEAACRDEAQRAIKALGPIARSSVPAGALAYLAEALDQPPWLLDGTSIAGTAIIPQRISLADDLILTANIYDHVDPFEFAVQIMRVPLAGMNSATAIGFQVAPTLGHALAVRAASLGCVAPHLEVDYTVGADECVVSVRSGYVSGSLFRAQAISFLGLFFALSRSMVPQLGRSARVEASISGPLQAIFAAEIQCPVAFGAAADRLVIDRAIADQPNPRFDAAMWELLQRGTAPTPAPAGQALSELLLARIRAHLDQRRLPRLKQVADELDMSERTIVRQLSLEGTSYRLLVDAERRDRALHLLADRQVELSQISEMLGFSDRPSFWRTFRRWFGVTPSQYRRD